LLPRVVFLQDLITDDEIISDSYDLKEIDGVAYEADCKKITIGGESFDVGGNASAEEGEEQLDDRAQTVLDVVHSFRLTETQFDKKSYLTHLKGMSPLFFISSSFSSVVYSPNSAVDFC
jgi:hypothetical protein